MGFRKSAFAGKKKGNKFNAKKVVNAFGEFDSKHEFQEFLKLKERLDKGEIVSLDRQVKYELIPTQYTTVTIQLKTKTKEVKRVAELPCTYIADFVTTDASGIVTVYDAKSKVTRKEPKYIIKRKLMRYLKNLPIHEL